MSKGRALLPEREGHRETAGGKDSHEQIFLLSLFASVMCLFFLAIGEKKVVLKLEDKKAIVNEVASVAKEALSLVAAEYSGLTVAQVTELRKSARENGVYMRVVRNTLARRALEGTKFACIQPALIGPLVLAFSKEEPGAAARIFKEFIKTNEKLNVKALALDNQLLPADSLNALASLPTRNEAIAQLMAVMQAPITKLVRTLAEPQAKLVRTLAALRDKKQAAA